MTYNVFGGTLNLALSIYLCIFTVDNIHVDIAGIANMRSPKPPRTASSWHCQQLFVVAVKRSLGELPRMLEWKLGDEREEMRISSASNDGSKKR